LHDPAEMIILDFRAAHVAAMDQHIGALSKAIYAVTRNRIATYRDDLTFGLKSVPVTLPSLQKCQRQVEPITMINSIGGDLPASCLDNETRRNILGDDRLPSAERWLSPRPPLPGLFVDPGQPGVRYPPPFPWS